MAAVTKQKICREEKVWVCGRSKGRYAAGASEENYSRPRRHEQPQISTWQTRLPRVRMVYSVRGLERSELGRSHGCPGRLRDRFLWQVYQNDSRHDALDGVYIYPYALTSSLRFASNGVDASVPNFQFYGELGSYTVKQFSLPYPSFQAESESLTNSYHRKSLWCWQYTC